MKTALRKEAETLKEGGMVRQEFVLLGCILLAVGLALCIVGYNETQPTAADSAISFMESLSGQKAPPELQSDKSGGYMLVGAGVLLFILGAGFILNSRKVSSGTNMREDRQ